MIELNTPERKSSVKMSGKKLVTENINEDNIKNFIQKYSYLINNSKWNELNQKVEDELSREEKEKISEILNHIKQLGVI